MLHLLLGTQKDNLRDAIERVRGLGLGLDRWRDTKGVDDMDKLEDPLLSFNTNVHRSNWEFLKARAVQNDTNVSAELRRILREEAEREAAQSAKARAAA